MLKTLFLLTGFISLTAFCSGENITTYYAIGKTSLITVQLSDSMAYVEYYYLDFMSKKRVKFDTLKFNGKEYSGSFSKIRNKDESLIFKPGNLVLKQGFPDSSFNARINLSLLNYISSEYKKQSLKWCDFKLDDFNSTSTFWENNSRLSPAAFHNMIYNAYDSLLNYYRSSQFALNYNKIKVTDCRIFPKKYLETSDTSEICRFWILLSEGKPAKSNMILYLVQFPVPLIILASFDYNVLLLASPVTYPLTCFSLYYTEKFIKNRIQARSTYRITFYPRDASKKRCIVKVRKSKILREDYTYSLPFDFEKTLLYKTLAKN